VEVFSPGQRLAERYRLVALIGSGGMSHVWRAVDEVLGRGIAVKTLDAALHADPQLRTVIRREARAAASIAHPNVTQVYDFGEQTLPDGAVAPYLVMELLVGQNLADRLGAGPIPWPEAVAVCADVASALAAAHRLGVVHRDIKPANVMLTEAGAKVVDFGIAAMTANPDDEGQAPRAGTPAYLAPEVVGGGPGTPESDMYALGAVLQTALTGSTPLVIQSWEQAALAHERGALPAPILIPDLPREVRDLCARCLSSVTGSRPTSEEAAEILTRWSPQPGHSLGQAGPTDHPVSPGPAGLPMSPGPAGRPVSPGPAFGPPMPVSPGVPLGAHRAPDRATLRDAGLAGHPASAPRDSPGPRKALGTPTIYPRRASRRRRTGFALLGTGLALIGAILLSIAAGVLSPADLRLGGLRLGTTQHPDAPSSSAPAVAPPQSPTPDDPSTPSAAMTAFEWELATAVNDGRINARAADDLSSDIQNLRDRVNRRIGVQHSAQAVQRKVESQVGDGQVDVTVGAELNRLLDVLIRLSDTRPATG
jgi:eukaryotic-like serine/threonine-protein kinase